MWTPERTAKFKATMAAKRAAGWNPAPAMAKTKRATKKAKLAAEQPELGIDAQALQAHQAGAAEFALDAIPERAPRKQYKTKARAKAKRALVLQQRALNGGGKGAHFTPLTPRVYAEYDLTADTMLLVLGKLRLPLLVKP